MRDDYEKMACAEITECIMEKENRLLTGNLEWFDWKNLSQSKREAIGAWGS